MQIPIRVTGAPEWMLLIHPFTLLLILFPSPSQPLQALLLLLTNLGEKLAIHHDVQQPFPVLLRDVADEPWISLSVETYLRRETRLNEEVRYKIDNFSRTKRQEMHSVP